jgi:predicted Fe-Mo cluster-binding NifX family protein
MKAAFTVWNDRIAPLFDVARQIYVVESDDGHIIDQQRVTLGSDVPAVKARQLSEMGIGTLVCGAISRSVQSMVNAYGIELVSFINGDLQAVVDAWQNNALSGSAFLMPGCRGRGGRRFLERPLDNQEEETMDTNFASSRGQGRGQGRGGRGRGGQGGAGQGQRRQNTAGPGAVTDDACVCSKCGHQEPHQRGVPCMTRVCPKCGAAMARQ